MSAAKELAEDMVVREQEAWSSEISLPGLEVDSSVGGTVEAAEANKFVWKLV
jgi:hypothetical protein